MPIIAFLALRSTQDAGHSAQAMGYMKKSDKAKPYYANSVKRLGAAEPMSRYGSYVRACADINIHDVWTEQTAALDSRFPRR